MNIEGEATMPQLAITLTYCIFSTLIFTACLHLDKSKWFLLLLLISPVLALVLINPMWATVGWHEFMHASIVLNIINGQVPPEDILLAGHPLKYPWAHHYLVALLCQGANIAPPMGFALLNVIALLATAVSLFKIAELLHPTTYTGIFAVFLSIFGTSIFYLSARVEALLQLDPRTLPLNKFASANSNPLGYSLFFVCFFFLMRQFSSQGKSFANAAAIFLSIAGLAFLYPICWLAMIITCLSVCLGQAIARSGRDRQTVWIILLALFFGSALAIPYLHSIGAGKAAAAEISLNSHVKKRLFNLFMFSCFPMIVLWMRRHQIGAWYPHHRSEVLTLVSGGIGLTLLYMFVSVPDNCEYKFLSLLVAVIGILIAPFFADFYQERRLLAMLAIALIFIPTVNRLSNIFKQKQFADPVYTKGIDIIPFDAHMQKLYSWIASKTPADTVIVDSFLTVPALSGRSLYVGTDLRRNQALPSERRSKYFDGWFMTANKISSLVFGENQETVKRRLHNASALLTPNSRSTVDTAAASIKQEISPRQVIVIVRDPKIVLAFDSNPGFKKRFAASSVSVYSIN